MPRRINNAIVGVLPVLFILALNCKDCSHLNIQATIIVPFPCYEAIQVDIWLLAGFAIDDIKWRERIAGVHSS